jgi:hypothetical protein
MSFVGLEWYVLKSSWFIKVVPFGMIVCSSFIILCTRSFCNSLSEVLGFRPRRFRASFTHAVSSGDAFNRKLSSVLFRWTPALCLSRNNALVLGDLTQWWYLMQVISLEPPNFASMNCVKP